MAERPTVLGKFRARMKGEVPADTLEAYRRAGDAVYDLVRDVEGRRNELKLNKTDPWAVEPATQALFLCTWNAFVLQAMGDEFLDADYKADPATRGYVPQVTSQQVLAFYDQVEPWLRRARQAQAESAYRLDVSVPAGLPAWVVVEPCPRPHLEGMLAAARLIRDHAEAAVGLFAEEAVPDERKTAGASLRQMFTDVSAGAEYVDQLCTQDNMPPALHAQVERQAKDVIERYYRLGQLLAMPQLLDAPQPQAGAPATAMSGRVMARPGEPGFDPWCLTDPRTRGQWQRDPAAQAAIAALWRADPSPDKTFALQAEIEEALRNGAIDYATDRAGNHLGNYYCCPWAPIYVVKRPVAIAGKSLTTLQQFTVDVSAEGVLTGEGFRREILIASFQPTSEVDYCDPSERNNR